MCLAVGAGGPCTQTFPGDAAFSEREVREVADYMENIPDLRGVMAIHSYGQMYMLPWGYTPEQNPDYDEQVTILFFYQEYKDYYPYNTKIQNLVYPQRLQKLIYLHLPTDCFMKISLQSTGL